MARWNDELTLISVTPPNESPTDGGGFALPGTETKRDIFGNKITLKQSEYYNSTLAGVQIEHKIDIYTADYNGETLAEYNGNRYKIFRTSEAKNGEITELTLVIFSRTARR